MDRNCSRCHSRPPSIVALRKESVDRNTGPVPAYIIYGVALRKESVDRNLFLILVQNYNARSLSARRAWIEMRQWQSIQVVAVSLSARRAWIEIAYGALDGASEIVALRKESVDRNQVAVHFVGLSACRSPQGERG